MDKGRKNRTLKKLQQLFGSSKRTWKLIGSEAKVDNCAIADGCGKPSVVHATVVIFLEFFAWGLLTTPTIQALKLAFPSITFLMNGVIQAVKGLLSFLSAPLIGAMSDAWGRKSFLLLCVFFTCIPIPVLSFSAVGYFVAMAISGVFSATFSIAFAYVADSTCENERSFSYGVVSATFAASLVVSPALGTWIIQFFDDGETYVVLLATIITAINLLFIVLVVPESLPEGSRKTTWGSVISWKQVDPFGSFCKAGTDGSLLKLSVMVFLSYLPEAGQYSCFFLYLKQVVGFSLKEVASFIAVLCISSVVAQTAGLSLLMLAFGHKYTIIIGLVLQAAQLFIYGIWTTKWLMWIAGILASFASITYPAISALVSKNADPEQQGVVLGILTGIRGLCMGLGPAIFGLLFYVSNVHLNDTDDSSQSQSKQNDVSPTSSYQGDMFVGIPFLLGVVPVILALLVAFCIKSKETLMKKSDSLLLDSQHST